ncbi:MULTISPECIES: AbgT family transporter [unclassified Streptomyces]|uniref:AbgT family transporter n=1 Tax=unclassified Streptomyces TaxID=2593676 RepID=UPI00343AE69A
MLERSGDVLADSFDRRFMLTVGFLQTRKKSTGIGTLVSCTLPVAMAMLVAWTALFFLWWLLGIPLGPGAPVR